MTTRTWCCAVLEPWNVQITEVGVPANRHRQFVWAGRWTTDSLPLGGGGGGGGGRETQGRTMSVCCEPARQHIIPLHVTKAPHWRGDGFSTTPSFTRKAIPRQVLKLKVECEREWEAELWQKKKILQTLSPGIGPGTLSKRGWCSTTELAGEGDVISQLVQWYSPICPQYTTCTSCT